MNQITAMVSMLHESAASSSATRLFRGEPVLRWTLKRLARSKRLSSLALLCWEDQLQAAGPAAAEAGAYVLAKGPRIALPQVQSIAAARRWSDGWRGGLLSTCDFDLGFYAPWAAELLERVEAQSALLIDPAAALIDAQLIDDLIEHSEKNLDAPICFTPAAPGLGSVLLRRSLLERLSAAKMHAGRLLHYLPDQVSREPLAGQWCAPVPTAVARTTHRFKLDSTRQINRLSAAMESLNGQLVSSNAEQIVRKMDAWQTIDTLPREIVLETTTTRNTRPIFCPKTHVDVRRAPLSLDAARRLIKSLSALDDTRLTLAGVGDPLLYDDLFKLLEMVSEVGTISVHVETDLLGVSPDTITRLGASAVDVVSVHVPALRPETYQQVMGIGGYEKVLENIRTLLASRNGKGVPILAPTFVKCLQNSGEMEPWYDQWLSAVGCAVVRGPSDYAGLIPDVGVADMAPPRRRPCARLNSRLTVLSDGRIASCEQDVLGRQTLGKLGEDSLAEVWQHRASVLRKAHEQSKWAEHPVCANCREWHRP